MSQVPRTIGGWSGSDVPIDQETLDILGKGDFLSRVYTPENQSASDRPVYRVLSHPENGRDHSFTQELPAWRRLGL